MRTEEEIREHCKVLKDHIKFLDEQRIEVEEDDGDPESLVESITEALTKLEKGMYVWVSENGMPELLIPLIDESRIEKFFREYPYMENKKVSFAQGVAANDLLIYVS